jgi:hypothetical protein
MALSPSRGLITPSPDKRGGVRPSGRRGPVAGAGCNAVADRLGGVDGEGVEVVGQDRPAAPTQPDPQAAPGPPPAAARPTTTRPPHPPAAASAPPMTWSSGRIIPLTRDPADKQRPLFPGEVTRLDGFLQHRPCRASPAHRPLVAEDRSAGGVHDRTGPKPRALLSLAHETVRNWHEQRGTAIRGERRRPR